jgi:hypothetical protein
VSRAARHRADSSAAPTRRQVRRALNAVGAKETPPVAAGFVAALAVRLAAQGEARRRIAVLSTRHHRRRRVVPVVAGSAAALAAVVLVGALSGWFGRGAQDPVLALAGAVDTTVVLPDGSSVDGTRGLTLPDGAVVRTGPNGRAAAGDVEIGPGLEARVDAGRLRLSTAGLPALPPAAAFPVVTPVVDPATLATATTAHTSTTTVTVPTLPRPPKPARPGPH